MGTSASARRKTGLWCNWTKRESNTLIEHQQKRGTTSSRKGNLRNLPRALWIRWMGIVVAGGHQGLAHIYMGPPLEGKNEIGCELSSRDGSLQKLIQWGKLALKKWFADNKEALARVCVSWTNIIYTIVGPNITHNSPGTKLLKKGCTPSYSKLVQEPMWLYNIVI